MRLSNHIICLGNLKRTSDQQRKNTVIIIITIIRFSQIFRKCTPSDTFCYESTFGSYMSKKSNKNSHLFPVQQLHSSLVTWSRQWFGCASACAPVHVSHRHANIIHLLVNVGKELQYMKFQEQCFTSLNLDSLGAGSSLSPGDLKMPSRALSELVSSAPFLELMPPMASQETALISGGKAPMVFISAVQGACCVGGRGTGLATPVAGAWLEFRPPSSLLLAPGGLLDSQFSFGMVKRGVRVPEDTFLFSVSFQSTASRPPWGGQ